MRDVTATTAVPYAGKIGSPYVDNYFGNCPVCRQTDGLVHLWPEFGETFRSYVQHWQVCHMHKVKWSLGYNLFSVVHDIKQDHPDYPQWAAEILAGYRTITDDEIWEVPE